MGTVTLVLRLRENGKYSRIGLATNPGVARATKAHVEGMTFDRQEYDSQGPGGTIIGRDPTFDDIFEEAEDSEICFI